MTARRRPARRHGWEVLKLAIGPTDLALLAETATVEDWNPDRTPDAAPSLFD